jgi:hypothetical protein
MFKKFVFLIIHHRHKPSDFIKMFLSACYKVNKFLISQCKLHFAHKDLRKNVLHQKPLDPKDISCVER